jgi:hypothetical protein
MRTNSKLYNCTVHDVLGKLKNVKRSGKGWSARCPTHDDQKNSLSVTEGDDGTVLIHCHAGCSYEKVATALNIKQIKREGRAVEKRIVAEYDYYDEQGELLYQSVRYEPKDFRQRCPDGNGGWSWTTTGLTRVLYRLPELLESDPSLPVFICEGEKDVEALRDLGLTATTNVGGANKWRSEYNKALRQRDVVIVPDNDDAGRQHAEQVAKALEGVAVSVRVVELPNLPSHGDVSDWLAAGGTAAELRELGERAPIWTSSNNENSYEGRNSDPLILSYEDFMKRAFGTGEEIAFELQRREIGLVVSVTNIGKSTLIRNGLLCAATGKEFSPFVKGNIPHRVGLLDFESGGKRLQNDLDHMTQGWSNIDRALLEKNFFILCEGMVGHDPLSLSRHLDLIVSDVKAHQIDLLVIDTCGAGFDIYNENDNGEVARRVMKPLMKFARLLDCAVIIVHHIGKAKSEDGSASEKVHRPRGASAFSGYAGSVFVLTADASDSTAVTATCAKNKNGSTYDVSLKHDPTTRWFKVLSAPSRTPTSYERVTEFVKARGSAKLSECVEHFKGLMSRDTVKRQLSEAIKRGELASPRHGVYASSDAKDGAALFTHFLHFQMGHEVETVENWFDAYTN